MERLNWHMAQELARIADVRIIGPAGSAALAPVGVTVREVPLKPLWRFLLNARALARSEAKAWQPDIVLAGSGLTAPLALRAARACAGASAVYVHGLDIVVAHPLYRLFWLPALRRIDRVIANSRATAKLAEDAGVDHARIGIVHPGVALPDADPDPQVAAGFRSKHGLGGRPLLLSVGRLSARKGLREFAAQVLPHVVALRPEVTLLIIGDVPAQALHAESQTPASIQAAAEAAGVGGNLRFLGKVPEHELVAVYQAADVHVFPVLDIPGDPEGFGMVAIEAAAQGLPTVAYATGGVVDAVGEGESGHLVESGDASGFAGAVLRVLESPPAPERARAFAKQFDWDHFGASLWVQLSRRDAGRAG